MELYMVRHGETIWNKEGRYYGWSDVELSRYGAEQAQLMGRFFKELSFDKVICSPLLRAVQTAEELTDAPLLREPRMMEQNFGIFEGKTYEELSKNYPKELNLWNQNYEDYCIPGGESFRMVRERVELFAQELWKEEGKVLLVAHKGTLGHLLASLLHLPMDGYWHFVFEQGTYSKVDLQDGYAILRSLNQQIPGTKK